jgi:hypothetical protein
VAISASKLASTAKALADFSSTAGDKSAYKATSSRKSYPTLWHGLCRSVLFFWFPRVYVISPAWKNSRSGKEITSTRSKEKEQRLAQQNMPETCTRAADVSPLDKTVFCNVLLWAFWFRHLCTNSPIQKVQDPENKMLATKNQLSFMEESRKNFGTLRHFWCATPPRLGTSRLGCLRCAEPSRCILA